MNVYWALAGIMLDAKKIKVKEMYSAYRRVRARQVNNKQLGKLGETSMEAVTSEPEMN